MKYELQNLKQISSVWYNNNPILNSGQLGFELDTGKLKIGTENFWNDTPYVTDWSLLVNIPTTLAGYGIIDASNINHNHDASDIISGVISNSVISGSYTNFNNISGTGTASFTSFVGNASSSSKLVTSRNFNLSGDVTSDTVSFDGTGNVNLITTLPIININKGGTGLSSIPTNGQLLIGNGVNYTLNTLSSGGGISISNNSGSITISNTGTLSIIGTTNRITASNSAGNVTLTTPQDIHTAASPTFQNLTLTGNLIVNGSSSTINSTIITIDDPILTLGGDTAPTTNDGKDRGVEFRWHNGTSSKLGFFGFDNSSRNFVFISDATNSSEVFSGTKSIIEVGGILTSGVINSSVAIGTSPLIITSNTLVSNLNSDLLDGQEGTYYTNATNLISGTIPSARITGTYSNFVNITGSGNATFANFVGNLSGNATTATTLATARTIALTGDVTGTATSFNGGSNISIPTLFSTIPTTKGGTGLTTVGTSNQILGMNSSASSLEYKTITAGSGITISNSLNSISISNSGVTSVGLIVPSLFSITGSPITSSGNISLSLANQTANMVLAGPNSGASSTPTFRNLVSNDIPNLDTSKISTGTFADARFVSSNITQFQSNLFILENQIQDGSIFSKISS